MHRPPLAEVPARSASLELLYRGSAESFVDALCSDALEHPAVDHPYLHRLADGDLPDMRQAIRDFSHQYGFYSALFPKYLEAVLARLDSASHRELVLQNLSEENGRDPANPENIPHTELFKRLQRAAGVTREFAAQTPACSTVKIWRDLFLQKCGSPEVGVGLGAIGIGTEMVVSSIYRFVHRAVATHSSMNPYDYLFLTLHMECDVEHADQMKAISVDLAQTSNEREALRFGVLSSLNLRSAFWDVMLARASTR